MSNAKKSREETDRARRDCATGLRNMAARCVAAEVSFVETLMTLGGIQMADAEKVFAYYRKHKLVKLDAVIGRFDVEHGAYLDRDIIRRAVTA